MNASNPTRLLREQNRIAGLARDRVGELFRLAEEGLDALFETYGVAQRNQDGEQALSNGAQDFAASSFASIASSIRSSLGLVERGFYTEAAVLHRSLTDRLIAIRYLLQHPGRADSALRWIKGSPSRMRVLYEAVMPGLYDIKLRAGGVADDKAAPAQGFEPSEAHHPEMACFDEDLCRDLLQELLILLFGFLQVYRVSPPGGPFVIRNAAPGQINLERFFSDRVDVHDENAVWRLLTRAYRKSVRSDASPIGRVRRFLLF